MSEGQRPRCGEDDGTRSVQEESGRSAGGQRGKEPEWGADRAGVLEQGEQKEKWEGELAQMGGEGGWPISKAQRAVFSDGEEVVRTISGRSSSMEMG